MGNSMENWNFDLTSERADFKEDNTTIKVLTKVYNVTVTVVT